MSEMAVPSKKEVFEFYEDDQVDRQSRIVYPHEQATETITAAFNKLREADAFITLVDGAFDVPHPNHEWYLRHCRLVGALGMLESQEQEKSSENIRQALGSSTLKLAVTVDADVKVSHKKGGSTEKGGVARPVYPWIARADRLAGYMFKDSSGLYRPTVDLVTVEGDDIHDATALESSLTLAKHLSDNGLLDQFIVYGEHATTSSEAVELGLNPALIPDRQNYAINPQTDEAWSSSNLIRRAQGASVLHPITRPNQ